MFYLFTFDMLLLFPVPPPRVLYLIPLSLSSEKVLLFQPPTLPPHPSISPFPGSSSVHRTKWLPSQ